MPEKTPQPYGEIEPLSFSPEDEKLKKENEVFSLIERVNEIAKRKIEGQIKLADALEALERGAKEWEKNFGEISRELAALEIERLSLDEKDEEKMREILRGFIDLLQKEKSINNQCQLLYEKMIEVKKALDDDEAEWHKVMTKIVEISREK